MKVLHLAGSHASAYYFGVSMMYALGCVRAFVESDTQIQDEGEHTQNAVLLANRDGTWSVFDDADTFLKFAGSYKADPNHEHPLARWTLPEAMSEISRMPSSSSTGGCDVVQPHMFCFDGMTLHRSIAGFLGMPLVGSEGSTMALTTHKWQTRAIVESHGVRCPKAQLLLRRAGAGSDSDGDDDAAAAKRAMSDLTMEPPFLIKPAREDNSLGISLVMSRDEILEALQTALQFDDELLVEQFIPLGRELRVGVIDNSDKKGDGLEFLSGMEYFLGHKSQPIRTSADKISTDTSNGLSVDFAPTDRKIPADLDATLLAKLETLAKTSHKALGCRHYSLYDIRVCPDGEPYFIECSPYCSFSPDSAIAVMGSPTYGEGATGACTKLFKRLAKKAIAEHKGGSPENDSTGKPAQVMGMRARSSLQ